MKKILLLLIISTSVWAQPPPRPQPLVPLSAPIEPVGNAANQDKILLGKALYWDEQLSSTKTVACASCHILFNGGTDPSADAINDKAYNPGFDGVLGTQDDVIASSGVPESDGNGVYKYNAIYGYRPQVTGRKAPSVINMGYANSLFWDGRATGQFTDPLNNEVVLTAGAALESQVLGPPTSSVEMGHNGRSWNDVISALESSTPMGLSAHLDTDLSNWIGTDSYFQLFNRAFGSTEITAAKIAMAIASYERSLYANQSPFDDFVAGNNNALSAQENRGLGVFRRSGCAGCHSTALLTDNIFHNTGVTPNAEDQGRYEVTGNPADRGRFKTPPLRNLENRHSFMHNGSLATLVDVIEFYNRGGNFNNPNLDPRIRPLNLSQNQKNDLLAFLQRPLTDVRVTNETGPFSRPQLYSESTNTPTVSGFGIQGTDNLTPSIGCIEPPLLGNSNFTVTLENVTPASTATLIIDTQDPETFGMPTPTASMIIKSVTTELDNANSSTAHASVNIELPNDSALIGTTYYARWYVEDAQASNGLAISPVLDFTLFKSSYGQTGLVFRGSFEK